MVRLKEENENDFELHEELFQYLYGAVKSNIGNGLVSSFQRFQYLYGAVKRKAKLSLDELKEVFQYLYGAVKSQIKIHLIQYYT